MNLTVTEKTALLLIDVQQGLDDPAFGLSRSTPQAEANISRLLAAWRQTHRPVIHIQHASTESDSPLKPEAPGFAFKPEALPLASEPVFVKQVNSAFIGTELENYLRGQAIDQLVVAGLTTGHCVSTSVRMAGNLGFKVWLVGDATAEFARSGADGALWDAETVHAVNLAILHGEFCEVVGTEAVLA